MVSKAITEFLFRLHSLLIRVFFPRTYTVLYTAHVIAGFGNNFQDHRLLSTFHIWLYGQLFIDYFMNNFRDHRLLSEQLLSS